MRKTEERPSASTVLVVTEITCDGCGADAFAQKFNYDRFPPGYFQRAERNTPDNVISKGMMFNEWGIVAVADLCEDCARRVEAFIQELGDGPGVREPGRPIP